MARTSLVSLLASARKVEQESVGRNRDEWGAHSHCASIDRYKLTAGQRIVCLLSVYLAASVLLSIPSYCDLEGQAELLEQWHPHSPLLGNP